MISVTLEPLPDGSLRATSRIDGRTVSCSEGMPSLASSLVSSALSDFPQHRLADGSYDLTRIRLNEAAQAALDAGRLLPS